MPKRKTSVFLTDDQWAEVRQARIAGAAVKWLAQQWGISEFTIRDRSQREAWPTARRTVKKANRKASQAAGDGGDEWAYAHNTGGARDGGKRAYAHNSPGESSFQNEQTASLPAAVVDALRAGDVAAAQSAMAEHFRELLAAGLPTLAPPATAREAATLFDMWRKAAGLDGRGPAPGALRLHAPRSIGRPVATRPPTPQGFAIE